ncbi:MerR family transcriptional regulator [Phenylobacterium sp.]|uniref:MerR family transcriptional regulator n=1 Tax=Phenylobacterium sp. TaxID=1871053 RepID=UPI0025F59DD9|nr:MerR family transcriptional regulator [Phenylobacterium sp.]MBX3482019.1 MerR family transcriptional regulator [Phenylobacterium sp.]MCW5758245.1 MerR family transcriptional regulator [Phenylobacterium sp.]
MVGISEAMDRFGMTARALHYYEQRGLIRSRRRPDRSRCYDAAGILTLTWIARLRRLGIRLADIETLLRDDLDEARVMAGARALLRSRQAAVAAELERIGDVLAFLAGDRKIEPWAHPEVPLRRRAREALRRDRAAEPTDQAWPRG